MKDAWSAFRKGIACSWRYWQILVVLYLTSLFSALPFVFVPALNLAISSYRTSIRQAAHGIQAWMLIETFLRRLNPGIVRVLQPASQDISSGLESMLFFSLVAVILAPFVTWVTTSFLSGGVLRIYMEAPQPFRFRHFLGCCWHWFGAFLILGVFQSLSGLLLYAPLVVAFLLAISYQLWLTWLLGPLLLLLLVFWLAWFEVSRVYAVSPEGRGVWRAALNSLHFLVRRPLALGELYVLSLFLLVLIEIVLRLGILASLPLVWWPVVIPAQQILIFLRLWARGSRLAGSVALVMEKTDV